VCSSDLALALRRFRRGGFRVNSNIRYARYGRLGNPG
jgi:hypothetical protein